jgi:hypothetical protein
MYLPRHDKFEGYSQFPRPRIENLQDDRHAKTAYEQNSSQTRLKAFNRYQDERLKLVMPAVN